MTPRAKWMLGIILALMLAPLGWVLWPPVYWADRIHARVVDAATGQPLAGVIVVAHWELDGLENAPVRQIQVLETMTDANGEFAFPAWGPRWRWPLYGFLHFDDPMFMLFKSGYRARLLRNKILSSYNTSPHRRSDWNGKTITLEAHEGSLKEYAEHVGDFDSMGIDTPFFFINDCSWKQMPRMLVAMHLENLRFKKAGLSRGIYPFPKSIEELEDHRRAVAKCGSIKDFLRSYLP